MSRNILIALSTTHHGFLRGVAGYAREHDWHIRRRQHQDEPLRKRNEGSPDPQPDQTPAMNTRHRCRLLSAALPALLLVAPGGAAAADKHEGGPPAKVGWIEPVRRGIEGWTVHVDPQLLEGEHAAAGGRALAMLANHLQRIAIVVPGDRLAALRRMEIWIERAHPELRAMQYHPDAGWLTARGYDPRLAKKVHITHAEELLSRHEMLKHPAVILHELAHAYHDQVLGFDEPGILAAYRKAMDAGIYDKVLLYNGQTVRHYAATDHKEYFAEATEAYFYRNDFYPFVRAELRRHDPDCCAEMARVWGGID